MQRTAAVEHQGTDSGVLRIFSGVMKKRTMRKNADSSETYEPYKILNIVCPETPGSFTIKQACDNLLVEEEVSSSIRMKHHFMKLPHYLILDLKRYQFDLMTYSIKKVHKPMQFDEYLTLELVDERAL